MTDIFTLLILVVAVWVVFHYFFSANKANPVKVALLGTTLLRCPDCKEPLKIDEMLNASVFWGGGAIVFDCKHCHDRVYFAPYDDYIETGVLGCAPIIDAIPYEKFAYPSGFNMTSNIHDEILKIQIEENSWEIPRYGLWNERAGIPNPNNSVKRDAARPLP